MSTNHNDDDDASAQLGRVVNQTFGSNKSQYNTNHRRETRRKRVLLPLYLTKQKLMTPKEENTYKLEKLDSFCFRGGGNFGHEPGKESVRKSCFQLYFSLGV